MAGERKRYTNRDDQYPPDEEEKDSSGLARTMSVATVTGAAERLATAARVADYAEVAQSSAAASLYSTDDDINNNHRRMLLASGGAPVADLQASIGSEAFYLLQRLQQQSGSLVGTNSTLWGSHPSILTSQFLGPGPHLQGPMGSAAGLPSDQTIPPGYALSLIQEALLNRGVHSDSNSLMHHDLVARGSPSNASGVFNPFSNEAPQTAVAAYLNYLSRRQDLSTIAAAQQYQVSLEQQGAVAANSVLEAHRLSSLLQTRNILPGGGAQRYEAPLVNLHQQDPYARLVAANASSLLHSPVTQTNSSVLPYPTRQLPTDGAIAPDFSAEDGSPNDSACTESLLTSNNALDSSAYSRSEGMGKKDFKTNRSRISLSLSWTDLVADSALTLPELRGVVSDVHFAVIAQMKPCVLAREDRVGLYKTREIGFPGMCCKHCGGVPGFGRYFPGSLTSLVNGNICRSIIKHLRDECRACPSKVRESILYLKREDELKPFQYRRGSRRQFFTHVWNKVQEEQNRKTVAAQVNSDKTGSSACFGVNEAAVVTAARSDQSDEHIPWDKILEGGDVVIMSDRHLVPDTIFAATAQTKPCQVTEADRVGRCKNHKLGSMGLCCKHCGGKAGSFGRYFPSNLHTFAQVEVCKQIVKHITNKCHACPPEIRDVILKWRQIEQTKPSKRYPSRLIFFRRVWNRFHDGDNPEGSVAAASELSNEVAIPSSGTDNIAAEDIPWETLVQDSKIVTLNDFGLISDSQFAAIAQMDCCELTEADRIGYNKSREIGFVGFCCRHCGGRPGFGRYFPDSIRNLEKTSARDTIVSHISLFCQQCPGDVRNALLSLKRIESSHDGSATMKGLIYGSGKLFFRRVWSRLHGDSAEPEESKPAGVGSYSKSRKDPSTAKNYTKQERSVASESGNYSSDEGTVNSDGDSDSGSSALKGKRKSEPSAPPRDRAKRRKESP